MRNEELKKARKKLEDELHIPVNELDNIVINSLKNIKANRIARNTRISNERLNELLEGDKEVRADLLIKALNKTKINPNSLTVEISDVLEAIEYKDFKRDDILRLIKLNSYDLVVKSAYSGVPLNKFVYHTHEREQILMKRILNNIKFKNIKIDKNLISLLMFTDNTIFKRQLFYPAFFIDADFKFDERFIVKGVMVFECSSVEKMENDRRMVKISFDEGLPVNDARIHFTLIDTQRNDVTAFGVSFNDIEKGKWLWAEDRILPEYQDEKEVLKELVHNIVRIVCNVIDLIEGNKDELETRIIVPAPHQNEKRLEKGKSPITTTVIIKPKRELLAYSSAFEREHRKVNFSHRFVVRGHWRHFNSEWYKDKQGKKIWIRPFLKGKGILIKKDALFTDDTQE